MHFSQEDTQELPRPKFKPRHKKENNIGGKFLLVLFGLVLFLGLIATVDYYSRSQDVDTPNSNTMPQTVPGPTVTATETTTEKATGRPEIRTVTGAPIPGPTSTKLIAPTATVTVTASAKPGGTATVTLPPKAGPTVVVTKTVSTPVPGPTKIVSVCYDSNMLQIPCP